MSHAQHSFVVIAVLAICFGAAVPSLAAEADNLLANASFDESPDGKPVAWNTQTWSGKPSFETASPGRSGKGCVLVASEEGADAAWCTIVDVRPFSTYRLSGWIKTENVTPKRGRGALLNLHNIQPVATQALTGTQDWTFVEVVFDTAEQDSVQVNCLLGGWGLCTGKAWYDDIELVCLKTRPLELKIAIDASRRGEPVSKYIYGQFIEHLGRCIYGGIWAEMLEDRKFYYPVTADYKPYNRLEDTAFPVVGASPWEIAGPGDSVTMVRDDSFVGDHTPRIAAGSAIRQNDLAVVEGKEYTGYIWLRSPGKSATATVTLGNAANETLVAQVGSDYRKYPLGFTALVSTERASLTVAVADAACDVGTISLMPADNVHGMRADTLALLKELDSPVYRWPGGNFVSGYDWRDGIGDRDRRPPRTNPAWTGVEHNDFGLDDFMTFCALIDTEPLVVVNSGLGGTEMAVEELRYANAPADSPMGKRRAENGHADPYNVKWWGIGNEMYGGWQLGHMPLEDYIKKNNVFADALRAADPSVKLVAVGAAGPWSEGMMAHSADHMDLISEHFYCQTRPGLASHIRQMTDKVRFKAEAHRRYRREIGALEGKDIRIALDEWNYWYGPHLYGELGTRYFLKDALGIAAGINEMVRSSDLFFMANYAQTVNVIGCIKTSKTDAAFATTGLVLKLYRERFGVLPVAVETSPLLDAAAALSADGKTLTVAIVNPMPEEAKVPLELEGVALTGSGTLWQIAGSDPMSYNAPGEAPQVAIEESPVSDVSDRLTVEGCSVSLYELEVE